MSLMSENVDSKKFLRSALLAFMLVTVAVVGAAIIYDAVKIDANINIIEPPPDDTHVDAWAVNTTILWFDAIYPGDTSAPILVTLTNVSGGARLLTPGLEEAPVYLDLVVYDAQGDPYTATMIPAGGSIDLKLAIHAGAGAAYTSPFFKVVFP
jgi:hypothetical protein